MNSSLVALRNPLLVLGMRLLLGVLLIWAGVVKAMDLSYTAQSMQNYQIVPLEFVNLLAMLLPAMEILVGVCLILGLAVDGAVLLATVLYGVFWVAVVSALARGLDITCGCFGTSSATEIGAITLMRNTGFLLALIPLWLGDRTWLAMDGCCGFGKKTISEEPVESASG